MLPCAVFRQDVGDHGSTRYRLLCIFLLALFFSENTRIHFFFHRCQEWGAVVRGMYLRVRTQTLIVYSFLTQK